MSIYLIDYENVNESGLEGVKSLKSDDQVHIFFSDQIKNIPFDRSIELTQSRAKIEFIRTHKTAKNYLDFQLSTYLGYLIGRGEKGEVIVVSNDKGFDSVVDFWKGRNITISRYENIANKPTGKNNTPGKSASSKKPNKNSLKKSDTAGKKQTALQKADADGVQSDSIKADNDGISSVSLKADTDSIRSADIGTSSSVESVSDIKENAKKTDKKAADNSGKSNKKASDNSGKNKAKKSETKASEGNENLTESWRKKVRTAIKQDKLSPGNYVAVYKAIANSGDKLELNNRLVKAFDSTRGGLLYNHVKDIFDEYKKSK